MRLTKRSSVSGTYYSDRPIGLLINRLAEFENLGVEPEELAELVAALREGRIRVLPRGKRK